MLALLRKRNPYESVARAVYARLLDRTRDPVFYSAYGVPDSFDGRFDLLVLHVFFVIHKMKEEGDAGRDFNQALFDATFFDMDQTLREMGIGDMGVPKHMRKMMKAFNGRMHAYEEAIEDDEEFAAALRRNLYGTMQDPPGGALDRMRRYARAAMKAVEPAHAFAGDIGLPKVE